MNRRPRPRRMLAPIAVLVATAALGAVATAPATGAATTPTGPPVRIGLEAPLTGDQAALGQGMLFGARLAADRANARGGFAGRPVEIVALESFRVDIFTPQPGLDPITGTPFVIWSDFYVTQVLEGLLLIGITG